jgi:hypothetical protein
MWKVVVNHPKTEGEQVTMYGTAANVNIAISKAKKKLKEALKMKSESDDLVVVEATMLHPIEF